MSDESLFEDKTEKCTEGLQDVTDSPEHLASALHDKGRIFIEHLSSIKMHYRNIALYWLGFLLAGLGWIVFRHGDNIDVNSLYLIVLLTSSVWLAIKMPMYLDLHVYHPQMAALFVSLIEYEQKNTFLTPMYSDLLKTIEHDKYRDPILFDALYYSSFSFVVAICGIAALYLVVDQDHPILTYVICIGLLLCLIAWECVSVLFALTKGLSRMKK